MLPLGLLIGVVFFFIYMGMTESISSRDGFAIAIVSVLIILELLFIYAFLKLLIQVLTELKFSSFEFLNGR